MFCRTVSEELLKRGYRVRGTTRDAANAKAIAEKFETLYGKGVFEVAEIKDYTISGAYNTVLQGDFTDKLWLRRQGWG